MNAGVPESENEQVDEPSAIKQNKPKRAAIVNASISSSSAASLFHFFVYFIFRTLGMEMFKKSVF
jgi:hypothetical protein